MLISEAAILVMHTHHFIRLAWIVQAEVVVDGLRRKHCGQPLGQELQAIEGTIAADTNQALNREVGQTSFDKVEFLLFVGSTKSREEPMSVPPLVGSSSGISW